MPTQDVSGRQTTDSFWPKICPALDKHEPTSAHGSERRRITQKRSQPESFDYGTSQIVPLVVNASHIGTPPAKKDRRAGIIGNLEIAPVITSHIGTPPAKNKSTVAEINGKLHIVTPPAKLPAQQLKKKTTGCSSCRFSVNGCAKCEDLTLSSYCKVYGLRVGSCLCSNLGLLFGRELRRTSGLKDKFVNLAGRKKLGLK